MATFSTLGTAGQFGNLNPTIVSNQVQLVAFTNLPWPRLINWKAHNGAGSVTNVIQATYTTAMAAVADTGADSSSAAYTTTARSITQTAKGLDFLLTLMANEFQAGDQSHVVDTLAKSYAKKVDTDIMALYTEAPTAAEIGAAGTPLTYANAFVPAFSALAAGSAPAPYFWVLAAPQIAEIGTESQFAEWQKLGQAWLDMKIDLPTGYLGVAPWGVECYYSNNYTASAGNHGMMFAREAFQLHEHMPFTVAIDASEIGVATRSIKFGGTTIYGVGGVRDTSTTNAWVADVIS